MRWAVSVMGCAKSKVSSSPEHLAPTSAVKHNNHLHPSSDTADDGQRARHNQKNNSTKENGSKDDQFEEQNSSKMANGDLHQSSRKPTPSHLDKDALMNKVIRNQSPEGVESLPQVRKPVLSESQSDFFKMLDDRIAAGHDYEPSEAGSRRTSARAKKKWAHAHAAS